LGIQQRVQVKGMAIGRPKRAQAKHGGAEYDRRGGDAFSWGIFRGNQLNLMVGARQKVSLDLLEDRLKTLGRKGVGAGP